MANVATWHPDTRASSGPRARFGPGLVEQVAMAAVTLSLEEFLDEVPALVINALPVEHCAVHTGNAPEFTPGVRAFPIGVHGNPLGMLTVWRDGGDVCLSAAEKSELTGTAAVIGLAMLAAPKRPGRSRVRS